ncbi:hypothetical protein RJ639_004063 [Escallonia herrerae]|uniref:Uncharacterized protein n=1 Tax=Escallonia herrerae TaxID=1293975 RepID=A0AA88VYC8_9ASTE|nr:hypothetical protein RJ639_004063 [Escallonia herrerae]
MPSVVAWTKNGDRLVGHIAKRQAMVNPENTFLSMKKFIDRKMSEVDEESKQVSYTVVRDGLASAPSSRAADKKNNLVIIDHWWNQHENIGNLNLHNINPIIPPVANAIDNLENHGANDEGIDASSDEEDQFNNLPPIDNLLVEIANLDAAQPMEMEYDLAMEHEAAFANLPMMDKIEPVEVEPVEIFWSEDYEAVTSPASESEDTESITSQPDNVGKLFDHTPTNIIANHEKIEMENLPHIQMRLRTR